MIKAVIFDLGGVFFRNGTIYAIEELKKDYGMSEELSMKIFRGQESKNFRDDLITSEEFWLFVSSLLPENLSSNIVREIWYKNFTPMPGVFELIYKLKGNVKLGIISGNIRERVDYLEDKYRFRKLFDAEVYSFDMKMNKPNREVWDKATELLGVKANECIYIDDLDKFVEASKKIGFNSLLFSDVNNLEKEFKKFNII